MFWTEGKLGKILKYSLPEIVLILCFASDA